MIIPFPIDRLNDLRNSSSPEGSALPSNKKQRFPAIRERPELWISSGLNGLLGPTTIRAKIRRDFVAQQVQLEDLAADLVEPRLPVADPAPARIQVRRRRLAVPDGERDLGFLPFLEPHERRGDFVFAVERRRIAIVPPSRRVQRHSRNRSWLRTTA